VDQHCFPSQHCQVLPPLEPKVLHKPM
jgi:hypothetical protein